MLYTFPYKQVKHVKLYKANYTIQTGYWIMFYCMTPKPGQPVILLTDRHCAHAKVHVSSSVPPNGMTFGIMIW